MIKSKKGFTLVELIVVIAILGILAGVGTVAYNGYIEKANDAAVEAELGAIATAAMAANAEGGELNSITVSKTCKTVVVTAKNEVADNFKKDFELFYGGTATVDADTKTITIKFETAVTKLTNSSYEDKGASWSEGKWTVPTNAVTDPTT